MKPNKPVGIAALMARMPRSFVEHAEKTEERASRRRKAQARQFELTSEPRATLDRPDLDAWKDTVADFCAR